MKRCRHVIALFLGVAVLAIAPMSTALAEKKSPPTPTVEGLVATVTGTVEGVPTTGTFTFERFAVRDGGLAAVGTLTGFSSDPQQVTIPVTQINGSCQILHLEVGPIDLDLLGLQVHLDQIVLDITAQSGPGNLLGNLLCAIAGLLDGNAPLNQLVALLNQLLDLLQV
jgi:hypothetical protein